MKIAILTASFLPKVGGAQVFAHNISRQLAASGNRVDLYVPAEDFHALSGQLRDLLRPLPKRFFGLVHRVPFLGLIWAHRYLTQRQRREGYDVWLVIGTSPSGYVATCLQGTVPLALVAMGEDIQKSTDLKYGLRIDGAEEANIARTVSSYNKLIAVTESIRTDYLDLGADNVDIVTIPIGVDLEWFAPDRSTAELRSELGWPDDRTVVLTTGRNHRKKGFNFIPAIAEKLRSQGFRFRWYVVGLGVDRLNGEIESRGLQDCLITLDQIGVDGSYRDEWRFPDKKLVAMYQAADIYAFPSLLESFGMVQIEAMAAGAAVVSTDAPGCREVVKHESNGLQAEAGNVDAFSNQLSRVLADPTLRAYFSANGRRFVQSYGWPNVAKQYEEVFEELIEARHAIEALSRR